MNEIIERPSLDYLKKSTNTEQTRAGFVYILDFGNDIYKIGRSSRILTRLNGLTLQFKTKFEVLYLIKTHAVVELEYDIQRMFKEKNVEHPFGTEYFKLTHTDIFELLSYVKRKNEAFEATQREEHNQTVAVLAPVIKRRPRVSRTHKEPSMEFMAKIDSRGRIQIPKKTLDVIEDREASFKIAMMAIKAKEQKA